MNATRARFEQCIDIVMDILEILEKLKTTRLTSKLNKNFFDEFLGIGDFRRKTRKHV